MDPMDQTRPLAHQRPLVSYNSESLMSRFPYGRLLILSCDYRKPHGRPPEFELQ